MADPGLTAEGFVALRGADFLVTIPAAYEALTGRVIDVERDLVLGPLIAIVADQLGRISEGQQGLYDQTDPNNATGLALDNIGQIRGVPRKGATYSQVLQTLTGTAGTPIPRGSIVEGGGTDDRARWQTTEDTEIGGGGTVDVIVQALERGAIEALAGEITQRVTIIEGWTGTTNALAATTGDALETDDAYRQRQLESLQAGGAGTLGSILAAVRAVDGVEAAAVVENDTDATAVVEGLTLAAHSVGVAVYPDTLTDDQKEAVGLAIYETLGAGIATNGTDVEVQITGADGYVKSIFFDFAADLPVTVDVEVVLATGYTLGSVTVPVQDAMAALFDSLGVGDRAGILAALGRIAAITGITGAVVEFNGSSVDVVPDLTERAVIDGAVVVHT